MVTTSPVIEPRHASHMAMMSTIVFPTKKYVDSMQACRMLSCVSLSMQVEHHHLRLNDSVSTDLKTGYPIKEADVHPLMIS